MIKSLQLIWRSAVVSAIFLFVALLPSRADEGMWMINAIDAALHKNMVERGLQLAPGELYNADAPGASVSDAVIALGFYCTGSLISPDGLLITNHHCAFGDIHAMSTPEHNYLEEGYWAMTRAEERPIPGKQVFFLQRVIDVTDEVAALEKEIRAKGQNPGFRKVSYMMENRWKKETGLEASLSSMWSGEKYYMALYRVLTDLRLVAAPPVSIAAFGGDEDNWEWPQHKCDFTLYRLYENGEPFHPSRWLSISTAGVEEGDFSMVIGYPGRTDRYASSFEVDHSTRVSLPISNRLRGEQMAIISRWMDADPAIRLKYSDTFFSLSNVQEMNEGEVLCYKRFGVVEEKRTQEKAMQEWIEADPVRKAYWGDLFHQMDSLSKRIEQIEAYKVYYRETIFRGTVIARTLMRMTRASDRAAILAAGRAETDPRVEHDLLVYAVGEFYKRIDPSFFGPFQKELLEQCGGDAKAVGEYLWSSSFVSDPSLAVTDSLYENDPLVVFMHDISMTRFNERDDEIGAKNALTDCERAYTRLLYRMREEAGIAQYPDANSTMRLTYGRVSAIDPWDGISCSWRSTARGLLEKNDPARHDFALDGKMVGCLQKALGSSAAPWWDSRRTVNFLTDNDITGGNSGSPVLNARGELIGLAFDGNKESLASDTSYTPGYNKCVCVDIRYVLWLLSEYAGAGYLIDELTLVR